MSLHHALRAAGSAGPTSDPYFKNTSLLLLGNGSNGGQNNTFIDSSSNGFTVNRYGNVSQGSFSPFGYNWSNYFDGNGDYLTGPSSSSLSPGTGDFTVECWINFASLPALGNHSGIFENQALTASAGSDKFYLSLHAPGSPSPAGTYWIMVGRHATSNYAYAVWTPEVGKWYHIAAVRQSGTILLFVNGTQQTVTGSTSLNGVSFGQNGFTVGAITTPFYGNSYISNLRYVVGSAVYTGNFTPSITNLTSISGTQVLTCQSNRFLDNSSNNFKVTPYGESTVTNFSPFAPSAEYDKNQNGGSGYFDNNVDFLGVSDNSLFELGSSDFTIEYWYYCLSVPPSGYLYQTIGQHSVYSQYNSSLLMYISPGSNGGTAPIHAGSGLYYNGTSSSWPSTYYNDSSYLRCWNHYAAVRSGSTFSAYHNGVLAESVNIGSVSANNSSQDITIGQVMRYTGNQYDPPFPSFHGYISGVRYIRGSAIYSGSTYTIPTAPLPSITNTSLLINFNNASIIDSTGRNDLETVGDAQISTTTKKFGTGSIYLDGNGDYLSIPYSSAFDFGTGDFTIEAWVYLTASPVAGSCILGSLTTNGTDFQWRTSTTIALGSNANAWRFTSNTTTFSLNTWFHIAVSRSSGTAYMWLNGSSIGSGAETTSFNAQSGAILIGRSSDGYFAGGYIDDLRITKGVARYTAAFTPPTRQLPAR